MNFSFKGIDHIQLAAPMGCEEQARRFYGDLLGLKEIPKPENLQRRGGCWFICGSQEIHIGVQESFLPAKKAHPGLVVENLEELRGSLQKLKVTIKEEAPIEGRKRFFADDPFGNRIEFLEFLA
ncbi:catechol 2,3-dioxygenase-like lactoylglutathione lyase family enzyme [Cytobacillus oceanisediminis]|jgi:catechol 2,3-dioxygenase-like lactoylglutathione lyase family enzyme|uniref:Catechol 2,3-dioxygenase-like lactoylglutathione lyase family enzyme n=1 Tax=Cytobacillus oceanisediminis TaxID=665099 RepID=A0A2V3AAD3_9BACI|nr:VOC family protein [Cytobacillus oceanisediminis]PWW30444.1 catechol 2,3-dioxygenase-like lactoylglutathione lyase family enzyme [Cytobacillus oceanisediminis]